MTKIDFFKTTLVVRDMTAVLIGNSINRLGNIKLFNRKFLRNLLAKQIAELSSAQYAGFSLIMEALSQSEWQYMSSTSDNYLKRYAKLFRSYSCLISVGTR
jgi:hypothetical protein